MAAEGGNMKRQTIEKALRRSWRNMTAGDVKNRATITFAVTPGWVMPTAQDRWGVAYPDAEALMRHRLVKGATWLWLHDGSGRMEVLAKVFSLADIREVAAFLTEWVRRVHARAALVSVRVVGDGNDLSAYHWRSVRRGEKNGRLPPHGFGIGEGV